MDGGVERAVQVVDVQVGVQVDAEVNVDGKTAREILRGCVCSRTRMLDRVLSRVFDDSLAPLGVRASQLTVWR